MNEHLKGAARSGRYPTPLLLVSLVFIIFSLVVDGQPTQEFISIDCGQENNYTDAKTGLSYVSDFDGFVDTGESHKIPINMELYALNRQGYHLRSFPNGTRNCYKISVKKDKKYLIRASFMYANYDQRNESPQFDLQLYDDVMVRVYPQNYSRQYFEEIQAVILRTSLLVCLVNIGSGTPFISSLELRPMNDEMHPTVRSNQSSVLIQRLNIQPNEALILRYPNDVYDRMWMPYFSGSMETLSAESNIIINTNKFQGYPAIPSDVLKTGGVPIANGSNMTITLNWSKDKVGRVEVLFYYAEIQNLTNQSRRASLRDSYRKTVNSTLPPLINAYEVFVLKTLTQMSTNEDEVKAMLEIKEFYNLKKNWEEDPCAPKDLVWEGIKCNEDQTTSSIISLNLTSNNLTGGISVAIKDLKILERLDLSNNNLYGTIPDFLGELENLVFLNLSGNNLNGSIPNSLQNRSNDGILKLSLQGNPDLCYNPNMCGNNSTSKTIAITIPIVVITTVIIVLVVIIIAIKKRKKRPNGVGQNRFGWGGTFKIPSLHDVGTDLKKLTYTELISITSNFNTKIGQGGFGTVYHGTLYNGLQVAVKLLSLSSSQGLKEFQTEAHLLSTIHHKNMVPLVGYCNDKDHLALVYQYMAGGNLKEQLSGSISPLKILCWRDRLRIAVEIAEGLDYLHRGCKLGIVHRDIKSSNILLSDKLQAMIADFGLSKIFQNDGTSHISTMVVGTPGYLDPEYQNTYQLKEKSDVYSFGIVLLELITGKPAIIKNAEDDYISIVNWVESTLSQGDITTIVDPKLNGEYDINSAWKAFEIASVCTPSLSNERSTMYDVMQLLKECLEIEIACETCRQISSNTAIYEDEMISGPAVR